MTPDKIQQLEYTLTQLGESYRRVSLTDVEKQSLATQIKNNLSKPQLPTSQRFTQFTNRPLLSPFTTVTQFGRMGLRIGAVAIVVISVLGTSLAAVSAQSLPGEILYGTKIAFEDLRSELTPNSEAQLAYDLSRTAQRFKELQKLNETGTLTPETATVVIKHIEEHTESATQASHALAFAKPSAHKKAFTPLKTALTKEIEDLAQSMQDSTLPTNALAESTLVEVTRIATETIEEAEKIEITLDEVLDVEATPDEVSTNPVESTEPLVVPVIPAPDTAAIDERIGKVTSQITPLFSEPTLPSVVTTTKEVTQTITQELPQIVATTPDVEVSTVTPSATPIKVPVEETLAPSISPIETARTPDVMSTSRVTKAAPTVEAPTQDMVVTSVSPMAATVTSDTTTTQTMTTLPTTSPSITHTTLVTTQVKVETNALVVEDIKRDYSLLLSAREEKNFDASLKLLEKIETLLATLPTHK